VSGPFLAHGTGVEPVVPDWPPVTAADAAPVLARYGLAVEAVAWRSPRPFSSAALVDVGGRRVFAKRHAAAVRSADDLATEHALAAHLRARGVPLPAVLRTRDGASSVQAAGWTWEVHEVAPGDDVYRDVPSWQPARSTAHAHALGGALGRLSAAAEAFAAPARTVLLTSSWSAVRSDDLLAGVRAFVAARPAVAAGLAGRPWEHDVELVLGPLHDALRPHLPSLPEGWAHGDCHPSNLLWQGEVVSAVLDLGLADRTTPLHDLATAVERTCVPWLDRSPVARLDLVDALLAGWASERRLDRAALAALLPLVHVEFALSEVGYYAAVVGSAANAAVAYEDYLLGHARWWAGPAGQQLRAHVDGSSGRGTTRSEV
jgi:Ser/Thr protein kinase RdoA (MazF antagonist)